MRVISNCFRGLSGQNWVNPSRLDSKAQRSPPSSNMTLLVMADAEDDSSALGETIAALMPQHPSRTILLRLQGGSERALKITER